MKTFSHDLTPGNIKAAMKAAEAVSADLWQVAPAQLHVLEGFNARVKNSAYAARVRWIADSIKANGYYKDKPLSGFVAVEDGKEVIYVTGGHRRYEAVLLAISEGVEIATVPVVIKARGTSMEDLTVDLVVGNEGEPLTTYEQAIVCKRLTGYGWDSKEIARRLGYSTPAYVDNLLSLVAAPLAIRTLVSDSVISATTAIEAIKKHGDKASEVLIAAQAKSGGRVTAKHLPDAAFKKALKVQGPAMYDLLEKVQADTNFGYLAFETKAALQELVKLLEAEKELPGGVQ